MKNILIFFCITFSLLCYADSWKTESIKDPIPKARGSHTLTKIGSDYYLFGGCDDYKLWKFNLSDNTFTEVEKFKREDIFTGHVALELSNKLYFLFGVKNNTINLKIYSYNFNSKGQLEEENLADDISALSRKDFAGVQHENSFYIFGGRKDDSNLVDSKLDFVKLTYNNKWEYEKVTPESTYSPNVRYGHKMISHEGDFYLFGGQNGSTFYNDVWKYDPDRNEWTELSVNKGKRPSGRSFSTMAIINSELWITGGISNDGYLKDTWKFDINKKEWEKKRKAPKEHAQTESIVNQLDKDNIKLTIWGGKSSSSNFVSKSKIYIYDSTDRPDDDDDDDDSHVHVFCGMLGIEFLGIICILSIFHNLKKKS